MAELNILFYLQWDMCAFTALDFIRTALQLVPDPELKVEIAKRAEAVHKAALLGASCCLLYRHHWWCLRWRCRQRGLYRHTLLPLYLTARLLLHLHASQRLFRCMPCCLGTSISFSAFLIPSADYGMLRFHPCAVGFACIDLACSARGFDVAPLRDGLASSGIAIEVRRPAMTPWRHDRSFPSFTRRAVRSSCSWLSTYISLSFGRATALVPLPLADTALVHYCLLPYRTLTSCLPALPLSLPFCLTSRRRRRA